MKTFRIVLGLLAVIPFGLLTDKFLLHLNVYDEDSLQTMAFHIVGLPILLLNMWAWFEPEIIEFYFWGKKPEEIYSKIHEPAVVSEYKETN